MRKLAPNSEKRCLPGVTPKSPWSERILLLTKVPLQVAGVKVAVNQLLGVQVKPAPIDLETLDTKTAVLMDGTNTVFPENYPIGVDGFYVMKYELTQEQYVTFLNQLNRSAQYTRTIGGLLDGLEAGDYVFGEDRSCCCLWRANSRLYFVCSEAGRFLNEFLYASMLSSVFSIANKVFPIL